MPLTHLCLCCDSCSPCVSGWLFSSSSSWRGRGLKGRPSRGTLAALPLSCSPCPSFELEGGSSPQGDAVSSGSVLGTSCPSLPHGGGSPQPCQGRWRETAGSLLPAVTPHPASAQLPSGKQPRLASPSQRTATSQTGLGTAAVLKLLQEAAVQPVLAMCSRFWQQCDSCLPWGERPTL